MHIAVIAADLVPESLGGAETHVVEVMRRLALRGYRFELFVGPDSRIEKILPKVIRVHPIKYLKIPNLFGLSYINSAPSQIRRALKNVAIDLLWAKQVFPQAVVGAILSKRMRKPLYVTAQNPLAFKEELVIKGPIPFKKHLPSLLTPLVKFALKNANLVAAVSSYSQFHAKKLGAKKTVLIPNGVDTTKFKMKKEKFKIGKKVRIVSTSALIPRNGLDTLIDAVALLPKSLDWELVIAGEGPEEDNLKLQMTNYKLEKKIKLIGRVENRKIPKLLASADLFVRLSRKEGFGVSFLEAMAAGLPLVATQVGGITDFVSHKQTGLLVEPEEPQEAAKAIELILTDKKLYNSLQQKGRQLVKERYNWEKIADAVDKAFATLT